MFGPQFVKKNVKPYLRVWRRRECCSVAVGLPHARRRNSQRNKCESGRVIPARSQRPKNNVQGLCRVRQYVCAATCAGAQRRTHAQRCRSAPATRTAIATNPQSWSGFRPCLSMMATAQK